MNSRELGLAAARFVREHRLPGVTSNTVAELFDQCTHHPLVDGVVLCRDGEVGDCLFFLIQGAIDVSWRDARDQRHLVATVRAPAIVGHWALIDSARRSGTCTARGDTQVLMLQRRAYATLRAEASPVGATLRRLLLASLSDQLTRGNARIGDALEAGELSSSGQLVNIGKELGG